MRVAYLMLAHQNPHQLQRLTHALDDGHDRVFVHLNKRSDSAQFDDIASQERVSLIDDRVSVNWGGYSMVKAQLNLMRAALDDRVRAAYFCFMTGSDYPLRSNEYMRTFLERSEPAEFINIVDADARERSSALGRLEHVVLEPGLRRDPEAPLRLACYYLNEKVLAADFLRRNWQRHLRGMEPYFGVPWCVLSADAVRYLLDFVSANPDVVRFMRRTAHPSENFLQTIIANSPLSDRVANTLTFEEWKTPAQSPQWLDDRHVDYLVSRRCSTEQNGDEGEYLFARKFPADRTDLLDRIDEELRYSATSAR